MIYFDNAATTKCDEHLIEVIKGYLIEEYFNPSAMYSEGIRQKKDINNARLNILKLLNGGEGQIIFTSSGSESNNLAVFGSRKKKKSKIITTKAEHSAIYQTINSLSLSNENEVVFAPLDKNGKVIVEEFEKLVDEETSFISIMHVNNETGAINDIKTLVSVAKNKNKDVIFHSDGVQAIGKICVNLRNINVDLYSFSGHKIHSPKGIGALYIKKGINLKPLIYGGGQEFNIRSSTENVAFIKSLESSVETAVKNANQITEQISKIKNFIWAELEKIGYKLISPCDGVANILTVSSNLVRGEVMQHALEKHNILVGTGSACSSNKATLRVPQSINLEKKYLDGIIRISFSKYNNLNEAEIFAKVFKDTYEELSKYV